MRRRDTAPPLEDTRNKEPYWKVTEGGYKSRPEWDVTSNPDRDGNRILCSTQQPLERDKSKHARSLWKIQIREACVLGGGETVIPGDIVYAPNQIAGLIVGRGTVLEEIRDHF